jgi:O-antigen ligase
MPALIILSIWLLTQVKAWRSSPRQPRTFALAGLVVAATLLVTGTFTLAQSRGGYLAVALTGVVLTLAVLPKHRGRLPVSILAVLLITIGTGYLFFGSSSISSGSGSTSRAASPALSLDTLEGRFEIWSHALSAIQDFPITGLGLNTFQQIVPVFYPLYSFSPDFDIGHAHNEFLQATLDLGLPGLIAFLSLYLIALWMLREIWNAARRYDVWPSIFGARLSAQGPETVTRCIVLGLTGGLLAHLFFGLTDAVPLGSKYGILFWMLLGLITGLFLQARAGVLIRPQTDPDRASLD